MAQPTHVVLVAGEASGDLLGARLAKALKAMMPMVRISGMGGQAMADQGVEMIFRSEELALVGISEVLPKLGLILKTLKGMRRHLAQTKPDLVILIDFPDFNFRVGKAASKLGIKVLYYVCPQVWAWRRSRAKTMGKFVDRLASIFPFEKSLMAELAPQLKIDYVGHPLLDETHENKNEQVWPLNEKALVVGLLPGSRVSEISRILPIVFKSAKIMAQKRPDISFVLPLAPGLKKDMLEPYFKDAPKGLTILQGGSDMVMAKAKVLLVASGTATLQAALAQTPMVVVYETGWFNYFVAKRLVKVDHIAMPNLVAGKTVVPELVQDEAKPEKVAELALTLLEDTKDRREMLAGLHEIKSLMGGPGASCATAQIAQQMISENN